MFEDEVTLGQILSTTDARTQFKLGQTVTGYDSEVWAQHREAVMYRGNVERFGQNPEYTPLHVYDAEKGQLILVQKNIV